MGDWWIDESAPVGPVEEEFDLGYNSPWHIPSVSTYGTYYVSKEMAELIRESFKGTDIKLWIMDEIEALDQPPKPKPTRTADSRAQPNNTGPRRGSAFGHRGRKNF